MVEGIKNWLAAPIGRWAYFSQGFILIAVKYNLDRVIAWVGFRRTWQMSSYVKPHASASIDAVGVSEQGFYLALLLTALPFLFMGLALTWKRLKSAGLHGGLCLLFFVPAVNLLFFLLLSLLPPRSAERASSVPPPLPGGWDWLTGALGSIGIVGLVGTGLVVLGVKVLHNYGSGLFVALPFELGLTSVLIYNYRWPRGLGASLRVAVLPVVFIGAALFAIPFEGLICLLMAAPIALVLALAGGLVGYAIQKARHARVSPVVAAAILAATPLFMGMESWIDLEPPVLQVSSQVDIDAPPEKVWPNVVAFSAIPEKREWLFHTGIAYPTHARIDGCGVGAVRHCIFSTGEFVEPVQKWDPPRLLAFSVTHQPEPLDELTPYAHIHPPHLDGYIVSKHGELRLVPLAGNRTRLEGTTWYTNRIWPVNYWELWSDFIIHRIHLRVLNHIKALSETTPA
ncbi:MAG: SRPBCC family protein [Verrucomicrobium sp.]|nr:SRPBCC family protein [Verrucomicrobium sp.]